MLGDYRFTLALAEAGSFSLHPALSVNVEAIDTGRADSGNSNPVNLTVNVTEILGGMRPLLVAIGSQ